MGRIGIGWAAMALAAMIAGGAAAADEPGKEADPALSKVKWLEGPCGAELGKAAEVKVPAGYAFAGAGDMKAIMEAMHNIPSGEEVGFLTSPSGDLSLIFEFDEVGYVKDDEKGALDADAILESIRKGTERANEERRKKGWPEVQVVGWTTPPHYDEKTHNLEWGILGRGADGDIVNYNTRLLGRTGVMKVTLVTDPRTLKEALPRFRDVIADVSYKSGFRYAEFRQGDKISQYGLTALVVGGGAAAAAKAGVFKGLWKILAAGAAGAGVYLKRLFGRKKEQGSA